MAISRSQMGSQLTGNKMKKKTKKMALGGLAAIKEGGIANFSPVAAVAKSIESGKPEGLLRLSPAAQLIGKAYRDNKGDAQPTPSTMPSGPMQRPERPVRGMRKGGKIDGCAMRGKTRGRIT